MRPILPEEFKSANKAANLTAKWLMNSSKILRSITHVLNSEGISYEVVSVSSRDKVRQKRDINDDFERIQSDNILKKYYSLSQV